MKRKLTENFPLKIMSLAVAVILWLLVVNINNPIITKSYTLTDVEIINGGYIENAKNGMMYMREEKQQAVRVTIKGEQRVLSKISAADIHAVADLQQAVSLDTDPVMVPITVTCDKISPENIEVTPRNLSVRIEEKVTQEFVVSVTKGESRPAKGYEVGTFVSNPEKIKITGPASLINKIDKVSTTINVEGKTEDVTQEAQLVIIDKNGDELSETEMGNLNIPKVTVTAKLWKVRSDVKIDAKYSGVPAAGFRVDSVVTTPDVVSVIGNNEALEELEKNHNTIEIPAYYVEISGRDEDYEEKINISELLPDGLKLTSDSSEDIFVKVNILPEGSILYEIPTKNISVENPPSDMQVTFETAQIEIRIRKVDEELKDLDENDIKCSINLKGKEEGSYELPVDIVLPDGYELVEDVTAEMKVAAVSEAEQTSNE